MRGKAFHLPFVIALLVSVFPGTASAERIICDRIKLSTHPWSWESIETRYAAEFASKDYREIFDKLQKAYLASFHQPDGDTKEYFTYWMAGIKGGRACCEDFKIYDLVEIGETGYAPQVLFAEPKQILLDCKANVKLADQMDEIRYFADAFVDLGRLMQATRRGIEVRRIRAVDEEFDAMLTAGFPMFPWEAALTSALLADDELANGPPVYQAILFHAAPGLEIHTKDLASSRVAPVLALEPFGMVRYDTGGAHKHWNAVAALTTFRGDMGLGVGAAYHRDNLMLGLTWHDYDRNNRLFDGAPFISLSVDLYQLLGERFRAYDGLRSKVRSALGKKREMNREELK